MVRAGDIPRVPAPVAQKPKGWPSHLTYLTKPIYSTAITADLFEELNTPPPAAAATTTASPSGPAAAAAAAAAAPTRLPPAPSKLVRITPITNPAHPAHGQSGLFATQPLPPNAFILPYLGLVHGRADADPASDYDLSLDRERGVGVDATRVGNEARFINDYRGVGPTGPNAEFREMYVAVDAGGRPVRVMGVFVLGAGRNAKGKRAKGIAKGEEILVSYGKGFWSERRREQEMEEEMG